ncbi:MAG TPA: choice-of-anchor tandem repeat GloVer-containing protein [Stenomitos sp.]
MKNNLQFNINLILIIFSALISSFSFAFSTAASQRAVSLSTLVHFSFGNGAYPSGKLTLGPNGNYYGMTNNGGNIAFCAPIGCGTFFKVTPSGAITTLEIFFDMAFGFLPSGGFVLGKDGNFYGSTYGGGDNLDGNIVKMTPAGKVSQVFSFQGSNGRSPYAGLILAKNGQFYGVTQQGGTSKNCSSDGCGTLFKITSGGAFNKLVDFNRRNGAEPSSRLLQLADGSFYGTATSGGANDKGVIFKLNNLGKFQVIVNFNGLNGQAPNAGLTLGSDGMLYGTTSQGGSSTLCKGGCGTVFRVSPSGQLKTLYSFKGKDGREPLAELTLGKDGNFYGSTYKGGTGTKCTDGCGTIFKMSPSGQLTTLIHFNQANGSRPAAEMVFDKDGHLLGTTFLGGRGGAGTIFRLRL